jgi:predicted MFS family arabinose efflux permease
VEINTDQSSTPLSEQNNEASTSGVYFKVAGFSIVRLVMFITNRMVFPFGPAIARGLGVSLANVSWAISARSSLGVVGPLLGSIADLRGRKFAMLLGAGSFVAGVVLIALWPTYLALVIGLIISGAGNIIYDSALQAYIGDRVPYERRSFAVAITELSFSGALIVGGPFAGWLIARNGWSSPFGWLGVLGVCGFLFVLRILPHDVPASETRPSIKKGLREIITSAPAIAGLVTAFLMTVGYQAINTIHGAWLEADFGLSLGQLGRVSTAFGAAGIGGVILAGILPDRIGKRRAVGLALAILSAIYLLFFLASRNFYIAIGALFLFYLAFEFGLVSLISLMTELAPGARATLMAANFSAIALGDALGVWLAPIIYQSEQIGFSTLAAVACTLIGLILLLLFSDDIRSQ